MKKFSRILVAALAGSFISFGSSAFAEDESYEYKKGKRLTNLNLPNEIASLGVEVYKRNTKVKLLTNMNGETLYTFADDMASGISTCYDVCETFWPPMEVGVNDEYEAPFGVHIRQDGVRQLTYDNSPLYTFLHDVQPGDFNGHLFEGGGLGQWFVVRDKNAVLDGVTQMKLIKDRSRYLILNQRPMYINPNVDSCEGACLDTWTPVMVDLEDTTYPFGVSQSQLTYKGEPLYTFNFDFFVNITIGRNFFGTDWDIVLDPRK